MRRLALVTFLLALGCGGAREEATIGSSAGDPATPAQRQSSGGETMSRASFLAELRPLTTSLFCTPGSYFRECFAVSEPDCIAIAGMAYDACAAQLESTLPLEIRSPDEGESVGQTMGACTGAAYDQALAQRGLRHDTPTCNDPSNWAG